MPTDKSTRDESFAMMRAITELQVSGKMMAESLKRLEDTNEGTVERKGMKERIALAEENIALHKQAWIKNEISMREMEERIGRTIAQQTAEIEKKISNLVEAVKGPQTFMNKIQPIVNILTWAITLLGGWLLLQLASGQLRIIPTP